MRREGEKREREERGEGGREGKMWRRESGGRESLAKNVRSLLISAGEKQNGVTRANGEDNG